MVLADNVDGGDDLDLIVTTMNGNVFCFSTPSPHHPLKVEDIFEICSLKLSFCLLNCFIPCFRHGNRLIKEEIMLQIGTVAKASILPILLGHSVMRKARAFGWKLRL